jgi:hypothetical protein
VSETHARARAARVGGWMRVGPVRTGSGPFPADVHWRKQLSTRLFHSSLLVRLGCGASLSMTRRKLYRLVRAVTIAEVRLQEKYSYSVESTFVGSFKV